MGDFNPPECDTCGAVYGHDPDCGTMARVQRQRAIRILDKVRALHQPVIVPAIPGTSLEGFTRCSCTPGLLYEDCATVQALRLERVAW